MEIKPKIREEKSTAQYGEFVVEPLPRGYGITLGTALRRVLLSSLPGGAITSVKVEGVFHEFSTLPGVLESVTEIVLNLKRVRLKVKSEESQQLTLRQKGAKEVKAADIEPNPMVEILNGEQHIATLMSKEAQLELQMTASRGTGYVSAEKRSSTHEIAVIGIDALFSPVRKVNVLVEDTRVGQATDFNKLILQLWTDGSISPKEALENASKILVSYFSFFQGTEVNGEKSGGIASQVLEIPIEDFDFSTRTERCLKKSGIKTIQDVLAKTEAELLEIESFGKTSLEEIKQKLAEHKLSLKS